MTWECTRRVATNCAGGDAFDAPAIVDGDGVCLACRDVLERRQTPYGVTD